MADAPRTRDGHTMGVWPGTETSKAGYERNIAGATAKETVRLLNSAGYRGLTVADLRDVTGWHHGKASSVLSRLHSKGEIARLTDTRDSQRIYITWDQVRGRQCDEQGRKTATMSTADVKARALDEAADAADQTGADPRIGKWLRTRADRIRKGEIA